MQFWMPDRMGRLPAALALAACLAIWSGCGGSGSSAPDGGSAADSRTALVSWPFFGRVPERTHYLPARERFLDPPLREAWSINTHALIEFPPAIAGGIAYVVNKYGNAKAVRLRDRKVIWERTTDRRDSGKPTDVTSPVYAEGKVFFADVDGDLVAVDAKSGKEIWTRKLAGHLESSPMAVGGTLYLGTDETNVVAVRASDGKVLWQFNSPGAIKASPSFHHGRLFVADYQSAMFCLDAKDGKLLWRTNTSRVRPYGEGGFYSSPAIAFGRVYAARDDGNVYAFDERTGKVDWAFPTDNFVYGSPAVAKVPGTPPSVYIGSYDEHFYALDARSGKQRWRYDVGGPVPGTATVIGHTVYTSSFKTREAIGIDVRTHRKTFQLDQAGYTPMVSDGRRLYLIGYYELIGLDPTRR
ncbi:MAG TPA: PQQ-binding-like beta-propeller repeat protein [Solirubrobacterales bacterium]|nr:PQQ-binding-like beta-propeller repeat protein [Solirubrobacterales bacterium]